MPVFNARYTISKAIRSVLAQSYYNWELIIVDDHSTDKTKEIVKQFIDNKIYLIQNDVNYGVATSRKIGIDHSTGSYIAFLDSDDYWATDKLKKQIRLMIMQNYDFTYTDYVRVLENGNEKIVRSPKMLSYKKLLRSNYIGCSTVVLTKKVIKQTNNFMPNEHQEDYISWLNILKQQKICAYNVALPLTKYSVRGNSVSGNKIKSAIWTWNVYSIQKVNRVAQCFYFFLYLINAIYKRSFKDEVWDALKKSKIYRS